MNTAIKVNNLSKMYKIYEKSSKRIFSIGASNKIYKKFYALKDVSFEIKQGESVGIIGHNGAGKSTLLKILTGVAFPTNGEVQINGKIASLLELGSGFNPELTGIENIYFNGSLNGLTKEQIDEAVPKIIDFADIGDFINQPVKSYSSGMFARLAFATAINVDPDILIVDEILSVGDVSFQVKCMEKFEEFKKKGKTILYVSHGLGTVKKFCERAIWLENGRVREDGNSVIVVEKYYNLNFNNLTDEDILEYGSNVIENVKIEVLSNEIEYNKEMELAISYFLNENEVNEPSVSIELRKTDVEPGKARNLDQFVCSFSSVDSGKKIPWKFGENKISFRIKKLNLMAGIYYFDLVFYDGKDEIYKKINIKNFRIDDKYRGEGFIVLEHKWNNA